MTNLATYLLISGRSEEAKRAAAEGLNLVRPAGGFILRVCLLQWALLAANASQLTDAAKLSGFVKAGYRNAGETMEPSERRLYESLQVWMQTGINPGLLTTYGIEGESWSEDEAAEFAHRIAASSA